MFVLRLGVYGLPAPEAAVIRTIVRLYANDVAFPWMPVDVPPYDAMLVDESATANERAEFARMAGAVLTLTRRNSGNVPDTLERPIRADKLQQWLNSTEHALLAARSARSGVQENAALEIEVSNAVRFTLRRWPPALLLSNDPDKVRVASLLVRRALSAIELAELGQLSLCRCVTFLQTLSSAGILELHVTPPVARAAHAQLPRALENFTPPRSEFTRSLINGVRRRLGLGTTVP